MQGEESLTAMWTNYHFKEDYVIEAQKKKNSEEISTLNKFNSLCFIAAGEKHSWLLLNCLYIDPKKKWMSVLNILSFFFNAFKLWLKC